MLSGYAYKLNIAGPSRVIWLPSREYSSLTSKLSINKTWGFASTTGYYAWYCDSIDDFDDLIFEINYIQFKIIKKNWIKYNFRRGYKPYWEFKIGSTYSTSYEIDVGIPFLQSIYTVLDYQKGRVYLYPIDNNAQCTTYFKENCPYSSSGGYRYNNVLK